MQKHITIILLLFISTSLFSQQSSDLFKSETEIIWLGIDYSKVQLTGDFSEFQGTGSYDPSDVQRKYFPTWNMFILNESAKYDIKGMLQKSNLTYDIDMIMELNKNASTDEMMTYNPKTYTKDEIESQVAGYSLDGKKGLGVLFIVESLNKSSVQAAYHFVAINLSTKEVLVHERFVTIPAGIGIRNFWAGSIYKVIKEIKKSGYKSMKSKY